MQNISHSQIDYNLKNIADLLILDGSFHVNPGLCSGKMGIAIFLYHYSRFNRDEIYTNFADNLLDQIFDKIGKTSPACFQSGMTGIGWGIEYLVQNNFVEANTDDLLNELDNKIYNHVYDSSQNSIIEDSLFCQELYFLARIKGREYWNKNKTIQGNKGKLIIYTNVCEDYLNAYNNSNSEKPHYFNSKYHLSMFHFLLEMKRLRLFEIKAEKLINDNCEIILKNIEKFKSGSDQFLLNVLLNKLRKYSNDLKVPDTYTGNIKPDEIIEFPLLNLLYNVNIAREVYWENIQNINIQELINSKIKAKKNGSLGLQNGLAGLGMALMELKNL